MFVPMAQRRRRPIPGSVEASLRKVVRRCRHSIGNCAVTMINTIDPRVSTYQGPPHAVLLDWSLVELILVSDEAAQRHLPHDEDRFVAQMQSLFFKVLAWRLGARGELGLAFYFLEKHLLSYARLFSEEEKSLHQSGSFRRWKTVFAIRFLLQHEFLHAFFFEALVDHDEAVAGRLEETCAILDRIHDLSAAQMISFGRDDFAPKSWKELADFLTSDDPGFPEEVIADRFAFRHTIQSVSFVPARDRGRLLGCIFGVSSLIQELVGLADPATLFSTGEGEEDEYSALSRVERIADRWRFRAFHGLPTEAVKAMLSGGRRGVLPAGLRFLGAPRRWWRFFREAEAIAELQRTVSSFGTTLCVMIESPDIQPYTDPHALAARHKELGAEALRKVRESLLDI